ncbi:MAG: GNAT family N-acetyltransferase, partial [Propionibacteriales bacterium]|nr:GNAT family N-acetyltransferase [Propionibacteriales bacterium]
TRALAAATDDEGDFEDEVDGDTADELIIRRARLDDAELLARLEQQASERSLRHVFGGRPFPVDDIRARWVEVLGNWRNKVRIAHIGEQPVGYVAYGEGHIHRLGVVEQHTRRGFGRQLLSYATDDVFRSSPTVELDVLADNHSAREFYRAQGWRDTGERTPSEFPPNPMMMRLALGRPGH